MVNIWMRSSIWMCVDKHQHDDGCNFYASCQFVNPRLHSHHYPSAWTQVGIVSSPWSTILTWFTPLLEHQSPLLNDLEFSIVLIDHFSWSSWHKTLRWSNMRIFCGTKHTRMVLKIRMLTMLKHQQCDCVVDLEKRSMTPIQTHLQLVSKWTNSDLVIHW